MRTLTVLVCVVLSWIHTGGTARARVDARPVRGEITVSAAASLTDAFTVIGRRFERRHPDATVRFNFGSSTALAGQIRAGAPVDVYAAADLAALDELGADVRFTRTPQPFARNRLEIAVKPGNPEGVTSLVDLADAGTIALCAESAPCGVYAASALETAGVELPRSHVTRAADARATLAAVAHGDADAAIVYATDVGAAGDTVDGVEIPTVDNVEAVYPIVPLADSSNRRLAKRFVAFVVSPTGQKILTRHGFLPA